MATYLQADENGNIGTRGIFINAVIVGLWFYALGKLFPRNRDDDKEASQLRHLKSDED